MRFFKYIRIRKCGSCPNHYYLEVKHKTSLNITFSLDGLENIRMDIFLQLLQK